MKNDTQTPVLILSAHAIALGIVRALAPHGVPVYLVSYDPGDMACKSKQIRGCFCLPHPEKQESEFIEGLLKIGCQIGRAVLIAADDPTLTTLSKNIDSLHAAFIIPTPDWSIIKKVINKDITYSIAEKAGIPVPKTVALDSTVPVPSDVFQQFKFPCLIKPVQSHTYYAAFKSKMAVVNNVDELEAQFNECRKKAIDVTVQEIIPGDAGQGFNFNSLFYNGKVQEGFAAVKVRMTDNGYGIPSVVKSRKMINELWNYSEILLKAIAYQGYSCIEYKFDQRDGIYKLLEVNGRYNRSSLLAVKSGLNFSWIEYNHLVNGYEITPQSYENDIYYVDEFKDFQENVGDLLHGRLNFFSFFKPYFSKCIFAIFSFRDPAPFFKRLGDGLRMVFAKKGRRKRSVAEKIAVNTEERL